MQVLLSALAETNPDCQASMNSRIAALERFPGSVSVPDKGEQTSSKLDKSTDVETQIEKLADMLSEEAAAAAAVFDSGNMQGQQSFRCGALPNQVDIGLLAKCSCLDVACAWNLVIPHVYALQQMVQHARDIRGGLYARVWQEDCCSCHCCWSASRDRCEIHSASHAPFA